jgi:hypothetical protein
VATARQHMLIRLYGKDGSAGLVGQTQVEHVGLVDSQEVGLQGEPEARTSH